MVRVYCSYPGGRGWGHTCLLQRRWGDIEEINSQINWGNSSYNLYYYPKWGWRSRWFLTLLLPFWIFHLESPSQIFKSEQTSMTWWCKTTAWTRKDYTITWLHLGLPDDSLNWLSWLALVISLILHWHLHYTQLNSLDVIYVMAQSYYLYRNPKDIYLWHNDYTSRYIFKGYCSMSSIQK